MVREIFTKIIFVSSSSCCSLIIGSALCGSWYLIRYSFKAGKLMSTWGWAPDLASLIAWAYLLGGTAVEKSSKSLFKRPNATLTGYSWSVIKTPQRPSAARVYATISYCHHFTHHEQSSFLLVLIVSDLQQFVLRLFSQRNQWIPRRFCHKYCLRRALIKWETG